MGKKLEREYFDEFIEGCIYHPKKGCFHPSTKKEGKFLSSLTDTRHSRHAPALDIDHPADLVHFSRGVTQLVVNGPRPRRRDWNALVDALEACKLVDGHHAKELRDLEGSQDKKINLPPITFRHPLRLLGSSTSGHFHLYIDHEMEWDAYKRLLKALCDAGVIGRDFCDMCLKWRVSFLLKPGFTKKDLKISFASEATVSP